MQIPPPVFELQFSIITTSLIVNLLLESYILAYIPPPILPDWHSTKELQSLIVSVPPVLIVAQIAPPQVDAKHQVQVELIMNTQAPFEIQRTRAPPPPDGFEQLVNVQFLILNQSEAEFNAKLQLILMNQPFSKSEIAETPQKPCDAKRIINRFRIIALLAYFE
ncbi:MAG: hypothetical protein EZS28_043387 [Streblomastix strix]|uniref:Uncharacterized protein n=1 Tax=Streblomastix strix TaxID=222440 RepID=A0A5J4TRC0_9EUKA|nr:MAG: hypothetical protein EZS28_043387 [Streblomastix strix]